jgi:hypothetical protein
VPRTEYLARGLLAQCTWLGRSAIFAWLDLLRMESSESKVRRGAAWMWPKEGWPAQHGAREKREARSGKSVCQFGRNCHGGAPGARGYRGVGGGGGGTPLQIGLGCTLVDVHPEWHPQRRWLDLDFESAAAGGGGYPAPVFVGAAPSTLTCGTCASH